MSFSARLYLDIDGVVNFFGSRNQYRKHNALGCLRRRLVGAEGFTFPFNWSAQLLNELDSIDGLEVVLLSTWNKYSDELFRGLDWRARRVLGDVEGMWSDHYKLDELETDQSDSPLPFVWADDTATILSPQIDSPSDKLVLMPDEKFGLTHDDLAEIKNFVNDHS